MEEKLKDLAKTILTYYNQFENIAKKIDDLMLRWAFIQTHYNITQMLNLYEKKVKLINFKISVDGILNSMKKNDKEILIERFFKNNRIKDIQEKRNLSERTVFRKQKKALTNFAEKCITKGLIVGGETDILDILGGFL